MILYHFTPPRNLARIAREGLLPSTSPDHLALTDRRPAVWLTQETTNVITAEDVPHLRAIGATELQVGDCLYAGNGSVRLTVRLHRNSTRLRHWATWAHRKNFPLLYDGLARASSGGDLCTIRQAIAKAPARACDNWWVYFGHIPPHKIEPPVEAGHR